MKTTRMLVAVSVIPLMTALAGCEHNKDTAGGPGGGGALTPGDLVASKVDDTASNALAGGETLKADPKSNSVTIALNYADQTAKTADGASFSIKKNADGGADITVNGQTVSFKAADEDIEGDGKSYGWEVNEPTGYKGAYTYSSDQLSDTLDGTDKSYLQVWQYWYDDEDTGTVGFAVVGAETSENVVKNHASATYSGGARVDTVQAPARNERTGVRGDLTLTADFAGGNVSGSVDNLQGRERGADTGNTWSAWQDAGGKVVLGKAKISSNGFSGGKVSLNGAAANEFGADITGSSYSGRFYGPDADQVGGVMKVRGKNDEGKSIIGTGYFVGNKQ